MRKRKPEHPNSLRILNRTIDRYMKSLDFECTLCGRNPAKHLNADFFLGLERDYDIIWMTAVRARKGKAEHVEIKLCPMCSSEMFDLLTLKRI